jgi:hypothetical protein
MVDVKMNKISKLKKPKPDLQVIGWMEHLDLPDIDVAQLKAKIDTGARTSALHATHIESFEKDGVEWVRFQTQISESAPAHWAACPVYDRREIKNTSGVPEERIVIRTRLKLTDRSWPISVSLADRTNMTFPMIVGRSALKKHNIVVHTRLANLTRT